MQMARTTPATMAACRATRPARGLADFQRVHKGIETLSEKLVDLSNNAPKLGTIKMTLHHVDDILNEQITLDLHDGSRGGPHEKHQEVVARFCTFTTIFLFELSIVEGHFEGSPYLAKLVQAHAHLVQRLAKVIIPPHGPTHLQKVLFGIKLDARLFFIGAGSAIRQRTGSCILPQRLQSLLKLIEVCIGTELHLSVDVNFEGSVVT